MQPRAQGLGKTRQNQEPLEGRKKPTPIEPWLQFVAFAVAGLFHTGFFTPGSRPGLHSAAASRLR